MEMDIAYFERELGISDGKEWEEKAKSRADLINEYCWSEERGMFMDYDFVHQKHSRQNRSASKSRHGKVKTRLHIKSDSRVT